jgi:heterodisulfide reductase subunit B
MTATAEPETPASLDVLTSATGRYPVTFTPAGSSESLSAGTLVVE